MRAAHKFTAAMAACVLTVGSWVPLVVIPASSAPSAAPRA